MPSMIREEKMITDICSDIVFVIHAYEEEIQGHGIQKTLDQLRSKRNKTVQDKIKINAFERYERAMNALIAAKNKYCENGNRRIDYEGLLLLKSIWKEEIDKYHVGWVPYYRKLLKAIDRIIAFVKRK